MVDEQIVMVVENDDALTHLQHLQQLVEVVDEVLTNVLLDTHLETELDDYLYLDTQLLVDIVSLDELAIHAEIIQYIVLTLIEQYV